MLSSKYLAYLVALVVLTLSTTSLSQAVLFRRSLDQYQNAVCSDGSPAVYYHTWTETPRERDHYKDFVIFLEGGGYCHTVEACRFRCAVAPHLCTSRTASFMKDSHGVMSSDSTLNPGFSDYYKVELPYCTGDMFNGRQQASVKTGGYNFLGKYVITAMIESLKNHTNIEHAENVILTGSSAGGAGVTFNCDYLKELLPTANIWCVVDAAFFYPVLEPFRNQSLCDDINRVLRLGTELWNAPEIEQFQLHGWWAGIQQNLFIGSARFDRFGLESYCGNTSLAGDMDMWGYGVVEMAQEMITNYPDIGLFMPGCVAHMMLTNDALFNRLEAGENRLTYAETLRNWVEGSGPIHSWDTCLNTRFCNPQCYRTGRPE